MINIMLVEDHLVVRNGIKLLLDTQESMRVVAEVLNGEEALAWLEHGTNPDMVITDINMPNMDGIKLVETLSLQYPSIKVIILSMLNNSQNLIQAFNKGAKGYLVKNVGYEELLFCVNHVAQGGRYVCEEMTMLLLEQVANLPAQQYHFEQLMAEADISDRELEVLQLISDGYTNMEIADKLFLSKRTVEGHRQNLIEKTGVRNTASLIKFAVRNGLVS